MEKHVAANQKKKEKKKKKKTLKKGGNTALVVQRLSTLEALSHLLLIPTFLLASSVHGDSACSQLAAGLSSAGPVASQLEPHPLVRQVVNHTRHNPRLSLARLGQSLASEFLCERIFGYPSVPSPWALARSFFTPFACQALVSQIKTPSALLYLHSCPFSTNR